MRLALAPIENIMHEALRVSAERWNRAQMATAAKGGDRQTLLGICNSMVLETKADNLLSQLFEDPSRWQLLPAYARTVAIRTSLLQIVAAIGCCLRLYLIDHHSNYPFKTFGWLQHPEGLRAALGEETCRKRLDRWTSSWVAWWEGSEEGLDSPAAVADLRACSLLSFVDNAAIEARHASIRREIVTLATQTHAKNFQDTSGRFVLRGVRQRDILDRSLLPQPQEEAHDRGAGGGGDHQHIAQGGPAIKKHRGGGGSWRAFMSERSRNSGGLQLEAASAAYRGLTAEQRAELDRRGEAGRVAHRLGGIAFGATKQDIDRAFARSRRCHEDESIKAEIARDIAAGLDHRGKPIEVPRSLSWEQGLQHIKSEIARGRRYTALYDEVAKDILQKFVAENVAIDDDGMLEATSQVKECMQSCCVLPLMPQPSGAQATLRHVHAPFTRVLETLQKALLVDAKSELGQVTTSIIDSMWNELHSPVSSAEVPSFTKAEALNSDSMCFKAGFCLCTDAGKKTVLMKSNFCSALTRCCPAKTSARAQLMSSMVVLLFEGHSVDVGHGSLHECPTITEHQWAYVGHQQLSLVLSYFLKADGPIVAQEPLHSPIDLHLLWDFATVWRLLHDLDKSMAWSFRIFSLACNSRPVGDMHLNRCSIVETPFGYEIGDAVCFWRGPPDEAKATKPQGRRCRRAEKADDEVDQAEGEGDANQNVEHFSDEGMDSDQSEVEDEVEHNPDRGGTATPIPSAYEDGADLDNESIDSDDLFGPEFVPGGLIEHDEQQVLTCQTE